MLKYLILTILFFSSIQTTLANIQINEVMSDPEDDEATNEWIELYNNASASIDIINYTIKDNAGLDLILGGKFNGEGTIIPALSYAILTSETTRVYDNFDIPSNTIKLYVNQTRIGASGLSNSGENLTLYDANNDVSDIVSYPTVANGNSYARFNSTWQETSSITPGKSNEANSSITIDYSPISITEFLPNPNGDDDASMPDGEWVEFYNSGTSNLDLLGFELYDNLGTEVDITVSNSTSSGTTIAPNSYLVVYMNGISGFLNNKNFEKIRVYDIYNNLVDEVSYSDSDEGVSWSLIDGNWEKSTPTPGYKNEDNSSSTKSELKIEEIYDLGPDNRAEWGDIIRVKIFAYKGNTNKNVVWMWIENEEERITKKSKFGLYNKFQNSTITYPLMISDNCNDGLASGKYKVVLDGLDARDENDIEIRGKPLCKNGDRVQRVKTLEYSINSLPEKVTLNEEFTTEIKIKNNKEESIDLDVWSYPYSGKKKFVISEKENLKKLNLNPLEEKIIKLKNTLNETTKEELNFKIKIKKLDRKIPYELKDKIKITKKKENQLKENPSKTLKNPITGNVVYESKGQKASRSAIFFLNGMLVLLLIYTLTKNAI
jgi:hypothetical protein